MALVLSRKANERVIIGDNIVVTVLAIDRNTVTIGVDAPRDVPIMREELVRQQDGGADVARKERA